MFPGQKSIHVVGRKLHTPQGTAIKHKAAAIYLAWRMSIWRRAASRRVGEVVYDDMAWMVLIYILLDEVVVDDEPHVASVYACTASCAYTAGILLLLPASC